MCLYFCICAFLVFLCVFRIFVFVFEAFMCIFIIFIVTCCSLLLSPHLPAKLSADRWELAAPFINRPQPSVEEKVQDLYLPTPPKWLPYRKMQVRALYLYFTWIHGAVDATIEVEMNVEVLSWTDILGFGDCGHLQPRALQFLATLVALHFTPMSVCEWVSRQSFDTSVAWSLFLCWKWVY